MYLQPNVFCQKQKCKDGNSQPKTTMWEKEDMESRSAMKYKYIKNTNKNKQIQCGQ